MAILDEPEDLPARLSRTLGPLRRAVLQATRVAEGLPDLPEAQIEVLRLLAGSEPLTPAGIATRLRLARSTVSNLLTAMTTAGLVERARQDRDQRVTLIRITPHAQELLRRYDRASAALLERALGRLAEGEREALTRALPALENLRRALG